MTSNIGYFALFLIMGIWHGLTWFYIAYGLYHATLICVTDAWLRFKKNIKTRYHQTNLHMHLQSFNFPSGLCQLPDFLRILDKLWFK